MPKHVGNQNSKRLLLPFARLSNHLVFILIIKYFWWSSFAPLPAAHGGNCPPQLLHWRRGERLQERKCADTTGSLGWPFPMVTYKYTVSQKRPPFIFWITLSGNWNVRQAMWQQVFRVTTFCISTCFQSFSTWISRIVHHAVLKFSPCRNKPLPQTSACPYQRTRSSSSVPQTQY